MFTKNCHKIQVLQTEYRRYKESKLWFLYYSEACSSRNGLEIYKKSDKSSISIQGTQISLGKWNFIGCEETQRYNSQAPSTTAANLKPRAQFTKGMGPSRFGAPKQYQVFHSPLYPFLFTPHIL